MTKLSNQEIDDYLRRVMPLLYSDNGVEISADIELCCFVIHTDKYLIDWFWKTKEFRVRKNSHFDYVDFFSSPIGGSLDLFCQFDPEKKIIIYSSAEDVNAFIERLLGMRVFT